MFCVSDEEEFVMKSPSSKKNPKKRKRDEESTESTETAKENAFCIVDNEANKLANYIYHRNNHVYLYTLINNYTSIKFMDSAESAVQFIMKNKSESALLGIRETLPLVVHINSPGGSVFSVFAMIDRLRQLKSMYGIEYHSVIEGRAASAATLLSVTADRRFITKYGYMLIHQLSTYFVGKYNEICDDKSNADELMRRIKEIYSDHATIPENKLDEILKHDLYWNAKKCLKYGLVQEVL